MIYFVSDDAPKGNYSDLKRHGTMPQVSAITSFRRGATNVNTWLLFVQYACCLGVELTMNTAASMYFEDEFGQSTESAAAIAAICGWMNLFARALGGLASDAANARKGMRGRIWVQTLLLIGEGITVLIFAKTNALWSAIVVMVIFSLFVRACAGATYGIVPYVDPPYTGSVTGIVGAGGSCGAVGFSFAFRYMSYEKAFMTMGGCTLLSAFLSIFLFRGELVSSGTCDMEATGTLAVSGNQLNIAEGISKVQR
jgi:NNP family nitrate/nitrite transporter-like MFS transporter